MSMIEKAAQKYKNRSSETDNSKKPISSSDTDTKLTTNTNKVSKAEVLRKPLLKESPLDIDLGIFDSKVISNNENTDKPVSNQDDNQINSKNKSNTEDETLFPEEDITDISGFSGYSVKAKKSKHSNNIHIDLNKFNNDGFLTPKHPDSELSSVFRMIKKPILNNAKGKGASQVDHPNLIQITSSYANEGKTYSAINIAISIAMEQDLNVLLIDADIRKPSLDKAFNVEESEGLTDLLSGKVKDMKSILYNTNIPSLTLMCAGSPHPNGTELLSSESMHNFIEEVSTRYPNRIIIFDSPPLLQTTESSTLASHMGQVVLVVEAETTMEAQVKKSIEILHNEIVLLLLNKQREKKNDITYGYGYGY